MHHWKWLSCPTSKVSRTLLWEDNERNLCGHTADGIAITTLVRGISIAITNYIHVRVQHCSESITCHAGNAGSEPGPWCHQGGLGEHQHNGIFCSNKWRSTRLSWFGDLTHSLDHEVVVSILFHLMQCSSRICLISSVPKSLEPCTYRCWSSYALNTTALWASKGWWSQWHRGSLTS